MYDNVSEIAKGAGPIASAHADAAPTYVHTLAENSTCGSTGPLCRIANIAVGHGVGRETLYLCVRNDGYMIFDRPDGQQQIVADVRYYTIDDAWNVLTGAADGQWAVRDESGRGSAAVQPFKRRDYVRYRAWDGTPIEGEVVEAWPTGWLIVDIGEFVYAGVHASECEAVDLAHADADEAPHETKRKMQDDGPEAADEQPLMCHQRPFSPGDQVSWFDSYYGACTGTLMWMNTQRTWFIQDDVNHRAHSQVHEDGLTLVEHAGAAGAGRPGGDDAHRSTGPRQEFQVRRRGELWREATIIQADTIVRQGGLLHFAHGAKIVCSWVESDVEVRQLCDNGA